MVSGTLHITIEKARYIKGVSNVFGPKLYPFVRCRVADKKIDSQVAVHPKREKFWKLEKVYTWEQEISFEIRENQQPLLYMTVLHLGKSHPVVLGQTLLRFDRLAIEKRTASYWYPLQHPEGRCGGDLFASIWMDLDASCEARLPKRRDSGELENAIEKFNSVGILSSPSGRGRKPKLTDISVTGSIRKSLRRVTWTMSRAFSSKKTILPMDVLEPSSELPDRVDELGASHGSKGKMLTPHGSLTNTPKSPGVELDWDRAVSFSQAGEVGAEGYQNGGEGAGEGADEGSGEGDGVGVGLEGDGEYGHNEHENGHDEHQNSHDEHENGHNEHENGHNEHEGDYTRELSESGSSGFGEVAVPVVLSRQGSRVPRQNSLMRLAGPDGAEIDTEEVSRPNSSELRRRVSVSGAGGGEGEGEEKGQVLMWEFKWSDEEDAEVHGPFDTATMLEWMAQGYFVGSNLALVRHIPDTMDGLPDDLKLPEFQLSDGVAFESYDAGQPLARVSEEDRSETGDSDDKEAADETTVDFTASEAVPQEP